MDKPGYMYARYSNGNMIYYTSDGLKWYCKEDAKEHQKELNSSIDKKTSMMYNNIVR